MSERFHGVTISASVFHGISAVKITSLAKGCVRRFCTSPGFHSFAERQ
jgi:hypothetical protein